VNEILASGQDVFLCDLFYHAHGGWYQTQG
jgi:hypothetical protein